MRDLGRPEAAWSVLITLVGVGLVLGIVGVVPLLNRYHIARERSFPVCLGLTGLLSASLAFAPNFLVTEIIGFLLGIAAGASVVIGYTLLQEHTEDETRARTFATFYTATRLALFAALGFGPFIAGAIGRVTMGVGGSFMGISGIRVAILGGGLVALVLRAARASRGQRAPRASGRCAWTWTSRRAGPGRSWCSRAWRAPASPPSCGCWPSSCGRRASTSWRRASPGVRRPPSASARSCSTPRRRA